MNKTHLLNIKQAIDDVNHIIENFLINMNEGEIDNLEGLDKKISYINNEILKLSKPEFETLKTHFEDSLNKVRELKHFLSNQLEATASEIKLMDKASSVSKRYNYAANDNS